MSYWKVYEILLNAPDKRLAQSTYYDYDEKCACVLGVVIPELAEMDPANLNLLGQKFALLKGDFDTAPALKELDATEEELQALQDFNDDDDDDDDDVDGEGGDTLTPGERYNRVLTWLKAQCEYTP